MKVPFFQHDLGEDGAAAMAGVLASPHLTYGPIARRVEDQLRAFFDIEHAALTNSWSSAALATFKALEIGPGDEVIVPAMTFVATANIPLLCGATPVLVDVDAQTLLIDPAQIEAAITPRTKAIFCVHLYGQMCDMRELKTVADAHDLLLLEDCAHAFEAERDGVQPGALSDAAFFSFYATKNVACGEGGAVITRDANLFGQITRIRAHGMSASAADRFHNQYYQHWDVQSPGFKASLPDLLACLLEPQIPTCLDRLELRQTRANHYRSALSDLPVRIAKNLPGSRNAEHLFPIWVEPGIRDQVLAGLNETGIGCTVNYRALPQLSLFDGTAGTMPISENWGAGTISLPLYPSLETQAQDYVIETLAAVLERANSYDIRQSA